MDVKSSNPKRGRRNIKYAFRALVTLSLAGPFLTAMAQSMSHEEEVVRNAYAKFSLLCSLKPVTNAAVPQLAGAKIDLAQLDARVSKATPVFDLTDFQTGPIASIANETWSNFVTPPQLGGEVLVGEMENQSYSDNGNNTSWDLANARWKPAPQLSPDTENSMLAKTVTEIIKLGSRQWSSVPVTYTRYVAFTVNATFQDKSTGPHKAIFFFGKDSKGNEFVAGNDLISGSGPLNFIANDTSDPSAGLLMNKVRETPIVASWLRTNTVNESACSQTRALCCSHGRCGISATAFNHALSTPLPKN